MRALLRADPAIMALAPGGIEWVTQAEGLAPSFALLTQISGAEGLTQSGPDGLVAARVQIDAWSDYASGADRLARAIRDRLNGYRGGTFNGIFHLSTRDDHTDLEGGGSAFCVSQDFMVYHRRDDNA